MLQTSAEGTKPDYVSDDVFQIQILCRIWTNACASVPDDPFEK